MKRGIACFTVVCLMGISHAFARESRKDAGNYKGKIKAEVLLDEGIHLEFMPVYEEGGYPKAFLAMLANRGEVSVVVQTDQIRPKGIFADVDISENAMSDVGEGFGLECGRTSGDPKPEVRTYVLEPGSFVGTVIPVRKGDYAKALLRQPGKLMVITGLMRLNTGLDGTPAKDLKEVSLYGRNEFIIQRAAKKPNTHGDTLEKTAEGVRVEFMPVYEEGGYPVAFMAMVVNRGDEAVVVETDAIRNNGISADVDIWTKPDEGESINLKRPEVINKPHSAKPPRRTYILEPKAFVGITMPVRERRQKVLRRPGKLMTIVGLIRLRTGPDGTAAKDLKEVWLFGKSEFVIQRAPKKPKRREPQ